MTRAGRFLEWERGHDLWFSHSSQIKKRGPDLQAVRQQLLLVVEIQMHAVKRQHAVCAGSEKHEL